MTKLEIHLKTLTPLWTGGADGRCDRVHETGIIGSLRWWYEAIVRGMGGKACDPTAGGCIYKRKKGESHEAAYNRLCHACQLFGCTSWQRKFKLRILGSDGKLFAEKPGRDGLGSGITMTWQFLELRPLVEEERWLLYQAARIAAEYGAIGGRTPRKPQGNKKVGGDYGLIAIEGQQGVPEITRQQAEIYLQRPDESRHPSTSNRLWPDLRRFFFVTGQFLWRKQINALTGLSEDGKPLASAGRVELALRGDKGVSKKIFSFEKALGRLWGYLPDTPLRDAAIRRLMELGIDRHNVKTGEEVLNEL